MTVYNNLEALFGKRIVGWKAIADFLEVDVRTAQRRAKQAVHPLPVRNDAGGVYLYEQWAAIWVHQTDMAHKAWLQLNGDRPRASSADAGCRTEADRYEKRRAP